MDYVGAQIYPQQLAASHFTNDLRLVPTQVLTQKPRSHSQSNRPRSPQAYHSQGQPDPRGGNHYGQNQGEAFTSSYGVEQEGAQVHQDLVGSRSWLDHDSRNHHHLFGSHPGVGVDREVFTHRDAMGDEYNPSNLPFVESFRSNDLIPMGFDEDLIATAQMGANTTTSSAAVEDPLVQGYSSNLVFPCDQCSRTYSAKPLLRKHARIAHGPKVHCCPFEGCSRAKLGTGFADAWSCKRHMKNCSSRPNVSGNMSENTTSDDYQQNLSPDTAEAGLAAISGGRRTTRAVTPIMGAETGLEHAEDDVVEPSAQRSFDHTNDVKPNRDFLALKAFRVDTKTKKHARKAFKVLHQKSSSRSVQKLRRNFQKMHEHIQKAPVESRGLLAESFLDILISGQEDVGHNDVWDDEGGSGTA